MNNFIYTEKDLNQCSKQVQDTDKAILQRHIIPTGVKGILTSINNILINPENHLNLVLQSIATYFQQNDTKDLLLYAHGGLNSEEAAVEFSNYYLDICLEKNIYPVFFIWHSGFLEILQNMVLPWLSEKAYPKELTGKDAFDTLDRIMEDSPLKLVGQTEWQHMKSKAYDATQQENGAGKLFLELLNKNFPDNKLKLHLAGHSMGSHFQGGIIKYWTQALNRKIASCSLLAPAISHDDFEIYYGEAFKHQEIETFFLSTMTDQAERNDICSLNNNKLIAYHKSLLYWVSNSFDGNNSNPTPLLGMEKFTAPRYGNNLEQLNQTLFASGKLAWERADLLLDEEKRCTTHGGFGCRRLPDVVQSIRQNDLTTDKDISPSLQSTSPNDQNPPVTLFANNQVPYVYITNAKYVYTGGFGQSLANSNLSVNPAIKNDPSILPPTGRDNRKKAFVVGINQYPDVPLRGCINDMNDITHFLMEKCNVPMENIRQLADERATKAAILERLQWLVKDVQDNDELYFFYSGHGAQIATLNSNDEIDGLDEIICPVDFSWANDNSGIRDKEFAKIFGAIQANSVKLIWLSDSCHSGDLERTFGPPNSKKAKTLLPPTDLDFRIRRARHKNVPKSTILSELRSKAPQIHLALLAACQSGEEAADAPFPIDSTISELGNIQYRYNGAFTYYLLKAFNPQPTPISLQNLIKFINKQFTQGKITNQTAILCPENNLNISQWILP